PPPARPAAAAAALMGGVGIVTLFTVFAASLKESTAATIDRSFAGDLVISSGPFGGSLSPELAAGGGGPPGGGGAVGIGRGFASIDGDTKQLTVADPAALATAVDVGVTAGSVGDLTADELALPRRAAHA